MNRIAGRVLAGLPLIAAAAYPPLVFCALVVFHLPLRAVSLAAALCGLAAFISASGAKKKSPSSTRCCLPVSGFWPF
ncbi:MAG: hypothetical protein LBN92_02190 [Treponema sp.]|nr:hypothetical protein [Treponema sp.]